ncbi:hypothetical protein MMC26_006325 [Xylographa opegraphella]|nr:hypothetical protein [Xylographa opegraphella]
MSWSESTSWTTSLLAPTPLAIAVTLIIAVVTPVVLHFIVHRSPSTTSLPSFLLLGPSNAGKTSLLTLFERHIPATTHTSQYPLVVEVSLPVKIGAASSKYRSSNDPTSQVHKRFLLIDTPGHGKLRHYALDNLIKPQYLKGIVFVVDAANVTPGSSGLKEAAEFLYDVLLTLQKRSTALKTSGTLSEIPVLIAANKLDLFTALPAALVKNVLEKEITNVRLSRSKGLLDSGIAIHDGDSVDDKGWLGDGGEGSFEFSQLEEANIIVTVGGGNVVGDGVNIKMWWDWIGSIL